MLTKSEIKKTIQKALIFSITVAVVVGAFAVINYFFRKSHVLVPETANVDLNESYVEDKVFVYGSATADYNTTVVNNSNTDVYVFVEFDSPIISGSPLLTPVPADGWVLYTEGSAKIEGQDVKTYIYAYGSGENMTVLETGVETGYVFKSVAVGSMTEAQYKALGENPFHVTVRTAVASGSTGDYDTVWGQVKNQGY